MAKIEIYGTPPELERISIFLKNNNIGFTIVDHSGNYSEEEISDYANLMKKYNH